jgi:hypothetical protein
VGHQVEYFLKLSPIPAKQWLSRFDGFWAEPESSGEMSYGEFRVLDDVHLHANLAHSGCWLRVPQIKYSWLIAGHRGSITRIELLERLLVESLPSIPILRVDELIRLLWEREVGRSWDELPDPIGSLQNWLISSKQDPSYYRLFFGLSDEA